MNALVWPMDFAEWRACSGCGNRVVWREAVAPDEYTVLCPECAEAGKP